MSTQPRETLVVFGYMRNYCRSIDRELPTDHLIQFLIEWLSLLDHWDKTKSHQDIAYASDTIATLTKSRDYTTCVGQYIVEKGMKQSWTIQSNSKSVLMGIIDNEMLQEDYPNLEDFTNTTYKGYGLSANGWHFYHDTNTVLGASKCKYAEQFDIPKVIFTITMELDLTQQNNDHGILRFIFHHPPNKEIDIIQTDGKYTNIAYETIDVSKQYRLAVDVWELEYGQMPVIELIDSINL